MLAPFPSNDTVTVSTKTLVSLSWNGSDYRLQNFLLIVQSSFVCSITVYVIDNERSNIVESTSGAFASEMLDGCNPEFPMKLGGMKFRFLTIESFSNN